MDPTDLAFAGAARQAEMVRAGEVSPTELVELYLERIERLDPQLNAYRVVMADRAREWAAEAERRRAGGEEAPLLGVPIAIKDGTELEGEVTAHGTSCFERPDASDSDIVARIRAAGAIPIGKTNLSSLAANGFTETEAWGITRNPWDTGRTPGGSSGGSAVAVAAGLAPIAHGSDGAGSIRWPSAHCGLFGLKPQRDRVSMEGEHYTTEDGHWHGLSVNGCLTRSVLDTAVFLDAVTAGAAPLNSPPPPDRPFTDYARTAPGKLRVAVSVKPPRAVAPPIIGEDALAAVEAVEEALRSLGHSVVRREPDFGFVGNDYASLYLNGIREDIESTPNPERLDRRTRGYPGLARLAGGRRAVRRAQQNRQMWADRINRIFDDHDLLLTLAAGTPPFEVGRFAGKGTVRTMLGESRIYASAIVWNYTGQPAAMFPARLTDEGLPVAAQLVSRPNDEGTLLSVSAQLEAELGWLERRPPVS